MRQIILITFLLTSVVIKAQTRLPAGLISYTPNARFINNDLHTGESLSKNKWSFRHYTGMSTTFSLFSGGSATIISAPVGLQLNRRLNDNFYAFANITAAPAYINFNHSFVSTRFNKINPSAFFPGPNGLGIYTAASMGLMYINTDKTFSISGSVSIERGNNYLFPVYPASIAKPDAFNASKR